MKKPGLIAILAATTALAQESPILIQNGTVRYYTVPKLKIHNREDLKNSPAKRQSLLEYSGLVTAGTLSFMQGRFAQSEALDGVETQVDSLGPTDRIIVSGLQRVRAGMKVQVKVPEKAGG